MIFNFLPHFMALAMTSLSGIKNKYISQDPREFAGLMKLIVDLRFQSSECGAWGGLLLPQRSQCAPYRPSCCFRPPCLPVPPVLGWPAGSPGS